jgi:cation transport ATPase
VGGNWAEALEVRTAARAPGPENAAGNATGGALHGAVSGNAKRPARTRTLVSDLFVVTLFVNSAAMLLTLHSPMTLVRWLASGLLLVELGAIAGIFVQQYRGILRSGMPRLAIAAVIKTGIAYYIGLLMVSFAAANNPGVDKVALMATPPYILLRQIDACLDAVLGLAGAGVAVISGRFTD